ncbi:MAG: hypothetical protein HZA46_17930 [Planctomycetales bacterium]|nr:hypothetical protein [Planctomycetales bacterium]
MSHRSLPICSFPTSFRLRRGAVLLAVLVCVVLVSLIALTLIKLTLAQRSQVQRELWRMQADWLVESGLERAAGKLANDSEYAGETWSVPAEQFGGGRGGEVQIEVSPMDGQPQQRQVRVQAIFPADTDQRAKSSKQVTVAVRGVASKLPANE